jgi:hypothetical protein
MCEHPEFYCEDWRTARKEHRCYTCGMPIWRGLDYMRVSGKWHGDVYSFALHRCCHWWYSEALYVMNGHDCLDFEDLGEWMEAGDIYSRIAAPYLPRAA